MSLFPNVLLWYNAPAHIQCMKSRPSRVVNFLLARYHLGRTATDARFVSNVRLQSRRGELRSQFRCCCLVVIDSLCQEQILFGRYHHVRSVVSRHDHLHGLFHVCTRCLWTDWTVENTHATKKTKKQTKAELIINHYLVHYKCRETVA